MQIEIVRLATDRCLTHQLALRDELRFERLHNVARQLVLEREDVLQLPVVAFRPDVITVRRADQKDGHAASEQRLTNGETRRNEESEVPHAILEDADRPECGESGHSFFRK